ncbi:Inner membrane protein yabI [Serratia quinivorans]|uniref:DedA family protein n=1 Tax=Serratia quinivorans TaxID=137545 RepID=UPI0021780205|nr:VTT domain-containing protein [Serratia quinivorans]CAI0828906.1 Inner membrane protein yabI [Serratia quinivorans]CAI0908494.1 Inner membrane protein yabI [Serratia quinivorans]CAI1698203.1 Inner membrane protein yabI [Serratia quinivorans]CAI2085254.1 Inner membrane protein yabI [Serratia quinivorans]CAI2433904.1 Inner membrane protein yabI [Serratia quinivorans]
MEQLTQIIAKYSPEPEFLLLIIFLFSLGKSVIFISSLLPPASVTLMLGIVAGKSQIPDVHVWAAITLGALLGSVLSFHCGALFCRQGALKRLPVRVQAPLHQAQTALQKKGIPLLFISRFLAVMRYSVPLVAGIIALPLRQVYCASALSAGIWALALMLVSRVF